MIRNNETFDTRKELGLIELLLPFFQLFSQYKIGVLSISTILLGIVGCLTIARNSGKIHFPNSFYSYKTFLAYIIFRDLIRAVMGTDPLQTQLNRMVEYLLLFFMVIIVCIFPLNEDKLYKIWKVAGTIFSLGLLYHVLQIYVLHQTVTPISLIPGYILRPEERIAQLRPSSFFAEPASFVIAMLPLEFLSLKRKDFKWAIFSTIAILLSASTVGVILSVILWTANLIEKGISLKKRLATIFIATVIVGLFMNLDVFSASLSKFVQVTDGESTFGSRVMIGYIIVSKQSVMETILGTNYNDVSAFVNDNYSLFSNSSLVMTYWGSQRLFLNTFSRLIFQYGIIGLILFVQPLIAYLKKRDYEAKSLIIMTLVAILGQTLLLNSYYFTLIMLFILYDNKYNNSGGKNENRGNNNAVFS